MKKNTAAAIATNAITELMKAPYRNVEWWIVKLREPKYVLPTIVPRIGTTRSLTNALTSAANATPMTKATATVTRLPRSRKSLNSLRMEVMS